MHVWCPVALAASESNPTQRTEGTAPIATAATQKGLDPLPLKAKPPSSHPSLQATTWRFNWTPSLPPTRTKASKFLLALPLVLSSSSLQPTHTITSGLCFPRFPRPAAIFSLVLHVRFIHLNSVPGLDAGIYSRLSHLSF
jgi:hypothetical protein